MRKLTDQWQKSSKSGNNGQCVEARLVDNVIEVRNSNHPTVGVTKYTQAEWAAFVAGVKNEEFEV